MALSWLPVRASLSIAAAAVVALSPRAECAEGDVRARVIAELVAKYISVHEAEQGARVPALSYSAGIDGELVAAGGVGSVGSGRLATERSVYRIGSLTKQFTAAAILQLVDERAVTTLKGERLTLDTPIEDVLPGVDGWRVRDQRPITVRSLLNMRTNLPNFTRRPPPDLDPWGSISAPSLLERIRQLPRTGWPDSFEYSNTSYFLIASVIEAVRRPTEASPRRYQDEVATAVLRRAGLEATGFVAPGRMAELATPNFRRRPAFSEPDWLKGSGDMTSSALDLFAWNKALIEGRVISHAMLGEMFGEGSRVAPTEYYGMGWFIEEKGDHLIYYHSGSVPGYSSFNVIEHRAGGRGWSAVSLLTNAEGITDLNELADRILFALSQR